VKNDADKERLAGLLPVRFQPFAVRVDQQGRQVLHVADFVAGAESDFVQRVEPAIAVGIGRLEAQHLVLRVLLPPAGHHLATAIAVAGIAAKGKRVRFYSTIELVNVLERENRDGKAGRCCAWIWSFWMNSDISPLARPAATCCSICSRSCTNTPASSLPPI
jgi:hypothetical protein